MAKLSPEETIRQIEEILCDIGEPFVRRVHHETGSRIELYYPQSRQKQPPKWLDPRAASPTSPQKNKVAPPQTHAPELTPEERKENAVRLDACLKDLEDHDVPRKSVMAILSLYHPAWKARLTWYSSRVKDVPYLLREEREWRKKLIHYIGRIEHPPLPDSLKQAVLDDSLKAIDLLDRAIRNFCQIQSLLAQTVFLRKGAWFSQARKELNRLMAPAIKSKRLSRRMAAHRTFELLKALAPEDAPTSAASIRSGSYQTNEVIVQAPPLPSP